MLIRFLCQCFEFIASFISLTFKFSETSEGMFSSRTRTLTASLSNLCHGEVFIEIKIVVGKYLYAVFLHFQGVQDSFRFTAGKSYAQREHCTVTEELRDQIISS